MHRIEVEHITKILKNVIVLDDVSFSLEGGKIYGFIGENGSGKTMLFRILAGLVRPTKGRIFFDGEEIGRKKQKIGVIIEHASLYPDFTGMQNLMYLAKLNGIVQKPQIAEIMRKVGLNPEDKKVFKKYSLGMKQRLLIAQALMEQPDFIFMDEPTNGLDKEAATIFRSMIQEEAKRGAVILIASHIAEDISGVCERIYQVSHGKIEAIKV